MADNHWNFRATNVLPPPNATKSLRSILLTLLSLDVLNVDFKSQT